MYYIFMYPCIAAFLFTEIIVVEIQLDEVSHRWSAEQSFK